VGTFFDKVVDTNEPLYQKYTLGHVYFLAACTNFMNLWYLNVLGTISVYKPGRTTYIILYVYKSLHDINICSLSKKMSRRGKCFLDNIDGGCT
jgi:hypothetical protein